MDAEKMSRVTARRSKNVEGAVAGSSTDMIKGWNFALPYKNQAQDVGHGCVTSRSDVERGMWLGCVVV
jgi:hypothetical protein